MVGCSVLLFGQPAPLEELGFRKVLVPSEAPGNCAVKKHVTVSHCPRGLCKRTVLCGNSRGDHSRQRFHQVLYQTGKPPR